MIGGILFGIYAVTLVLLNFNMKFWVETLHVILVLYKCVTRKGLGAIHDDVLGPLNNFS